MTGRSDSALTLPMRARFSSSQRCFAAICVRLSACWVAQPPHTPKCGQRGVMRLADRNYAFYLQDNFKVTSRLTITPGLRWDMNPAFIEKNPGHSLRQPCSR